MSLSTGPSENEFRALVSLFHQNEYKQAFADTNSLIDKHPNCAELFNFKGVMNASLGDYKAAIEN